MVSAIIVTYNRKVELLRCVEAVLAQSAPVDKLFVVDNASSDGTFEYLQEKGVIPQSVNLGENKNLIFSQQEMVIHYISLPTNTGGAGGFHEGLKAAYEDKADYYWLMDDDGYPEEACLEKQLELINEHHYVMPISLDINKTDELTWFIRDKQGVKTRSLNVLQKSWGGEMDYVVPFNGTLLTNEIVGRVGYPNKDFFIWGDDYDHYWRCVKDGYQPITSLSALFYHPSDKAVHAKMFFDLIPVNYTDVKWRFICLIRNSTYIYWNYTRKINILVKLMIYTWFFMIRRKFDIRGYGLYLASVMDGLRGNFNRHWKYLNK